jgi:hypothetical protein
MRMKTRNSNARLTAFVALGVCIGLLICTPLLSRAHSNAASITIVNNSSREIRHVYLSAPDQNNWGSDQLVNSVISANGGSFTLNDVSCTSSNIKVVAEDQDGCFSYQLVSCSDGGTWTITNDTARDCGN